MAGRLRIGTSGFHYRHWRGVFYPPDCPARRWLDHYVDHFDTVELNSTFYRLPASRVVDEWRSRARGDFLFAVKCSRYISHMKRLRAPRTHLQRFLRRVSRLGTHLGPILVQLPPGWNADVPRLDAFLAAAPRNRRFAVEVRDPSWLTPTLFEVLRAHGAALCIHDLLPDHPRVLTSDWTYLRFHGPTRAYSGSYPHQRLVAEGRRIQEWLARGVDVYAYFNNDASGHAVANAKALRRYAAV